MNKKIILTLAAVSTVSLTITGCFKSKEERYAEKLDLGDKYLKELNYEEALASYQDALKIDEKQEAVYERLVSVYHIQKDYKASKELLDKGIQVMKEEEKEMEAGRLGLLAELVENHQESEEEKAPSVLYPVEQDGKWGFEDGSEKLVCEYLYDEVKPYNAHGYAAVKKDGKWGYIDQTGKEVIPCQFEDAGLFGENGLAAVKQDGKWGFVDGTGSMVVEPVFEETGEFSSNGLAAVMQDGKWGYINEEGDFILEPAYDRATEFGENGLAAVEVDGKVQWLTETGMFLLDGTGVEEVGTDGTAVFFKDGKYGLTDHEGNLLQECVYDSLEEVPGYPGLYKAEKDGKYGLVDSSGKVVLDLQYEDFHYYDDLHFSGEQLEAGDEQLLTLGYEEALGYYEGALPLDGKLLEAYQRLASLYTMQERYEDAKTILEEGKKALEAEGQTEEAARLEQYLSLVENHQEEKKEETGTGLYPVFKDGKWGFKDKGDKELVKPVYDSIKEYNSQGLAAVRKDGKWGFVDKTGKEVIPCTYEDVKIFDSHGYAAFCQDGKWGYMDKTGKVIVEPSYENAGRFSGNGLAAVKQDGKWGWINESGEIVIEPAYEKISLFDKKGLAAVVMDKQQYWINESGVPVTEPEKKHIASQDGEGFAIAKEGKGYTLKDFQGKMLLDKVYENMEAIPNWPGLYKVSKDGKYGVIDKTGKEVLELKYGDFTYFDQDHLAYFEKDKDGNIVKMRYEGEYPKAISGTYQWQDESPKDEYGYRVEMIDKCTFYLDGTCTFEETYTVLEGPPNGRCRRTWRDGSWSREVYVGDSTQHITNSTYVVYDNGVVGIEGLFGEPIEAINVTDAIY